MANMDELRAEIDVNEADLIKVRLGQRVEVTPDAYPERRYVSSVVKLHPQINRQKGTLKVEVRIHEPDGWLRPDMSVRLRFLEEARSASPERGALLAPREALHSDAAGTFVWIVSGERLRRQAVSAGAAAPGNRVIIVRGLSGGEALVLGEAAGLIAGQRVAIEP